LLVLSANRPNVHYRHHCTSSLYKYSSCKWPWDKDELT